MGSEQDALDRARQQNVYLGIPAWTVSIVSGAKSVDNVPMGLPGGTGTGKAQGQARGPQFSLHPTSIPMFVK